jgi:hypothetical protein
MSMLFLGSTAIALTLLQAATAPPQVLDPKTERDAFSVYATLLQPTMLRPDRLKYEGLTEPILLQAETEEPTSCAEFLAEMSGEWAEVASNFRRENTRARLLRAGLPLGVKYRLISRKEILAHDARLAAKDPVRRNAPRPGSLRYIALSAVGFNAARTKALVYARFRTLHYSHEFRMKELKEGKWVDGPRACGGTA